MSQSRPEVLNHSLQEADIWLRELCEEGGFATPEQAYTALRAVLHALRDRLTTEMAIKLSAQLPLVFKGVFIDSWHPGATPEKIDTPEQFLDKVTQHASGSNNLDPERATRGVIKLLNRKISSAQLDKAIEQLPDALEQYLKQAA